VDQYNAGEPEFHAVDPPSEQARERALRRYDRLIKPPGSLGRLEGLGAWLAACQGQCPPQPLTQPRAVAFPGDHGIAARDVSIYSAEHTPQFTRALRQGGTALHALVEGTGATLRIAELDPERSGAIDVEDAFTAEQTTTLLQAGAACADAEVDSGADLLIPATVGVAGTTPATVLVAALTGVEPVAVVGRGSGIDDRTWMRKTRAVRDALRRTGAQRNDPLALLRIAGGADLTAVTGFLAQAAVRRTPVLLDGLNSTAAGLLAERLAPGARAWWQPAQESPEPAHSRALRELELDPIRDLGISLQQGAAAATALPLLHTAVRTLRDIRTHDEAGVSPPAQHRIS